MNPIYYVAITILILSLIIQIILLQVLKPEKETEVNDDVYLVPREVNPLVYDPRVYRKV